jgi:ATP adenylyltransferase/5',5'''-P-1,P-4-tetraphosphate phosphorylase II
MFRDYLLLVLRDHEHVKHPDDPKANLAVNSLGFAGLFAVKNTESLEYFKEVKPLRVLEMLAISASLPR